MKQIKVITSSDKSGFEEEINNLLLDKWEILSTSCGFVNSEQYDFCESFQAVMINNNSGVNDNEIVNNVDNVDNVDNEIDDNEITKFINNCKDCGKNVKPIEGSEMVACVKCGEEYPF